MPRKPKPLTDAQKPRAQELRTKIQHAIARSREREAEIRRLVQAEALADSIASWKLTWEMLRDGVSATTLSDIVGVSRATLYSYARQYEAHMGGREAIPAAEAQRKPWTILDDLNGDEYTVSHPDLGEFSATFEEDGSLTIWKAGKVYKPISREHADNRDGGDWTEEMELLYLPLVAFRDSQGEPQSAVDAEPHEEEPDGLGFLDDEEVSDEA